MHSGVTSTPKLLIITFGLANYLLLTATELNKHRWFRRIAPLEITKSVSEPQFIHVVFGRQYTEHEVGIKHEFEHIWKNH
jgi:hypothetical protein